MGPAFGPILAGWFLQYADWRYIFLINVPVGIVAVLVALRALPMLSALRATGGIDLPGAILGPLGFAALSYGISQSASMGWGDRNTIAGLSTYLYDRATTHLATARHAIASYQQALMAQAAAAHPGAVSASAGQATPPHAMVAAMQHYATHATQGALTQAFDDMFLASTVVVGVALLLAFTLRRHPRATQDPADGDIGMEVMVA
ncbi:MAG TPA: hypothetical protein VFE42_26260 [Chloroflexota bacterium]|nr:hypothetical protein [Chloroflexota bacterium]